MIFLPGYPAGLNQDTQVGLVQLQVSVSQKLRETSLALAQKPLVHLSSLFLLSYLDGVPRRRGTVSVYHHGGTGNEGVHSCVERKNWEGHGQFAMRPTANLSTGWDTPQGQGLGFVCLQQYF